ncbi:MAG: serine/threonine-protein kinase [Myxococcota bacterium]
MAGELDDTVDAAALDATVASAAVADTAAGSDLADTELPRGRPKGRIGGTDLEEDLAEQRLAAKMFPGTFAPVRIGRFALLERIGAGAMGVVHAGYDDTLDRKVAIKLISSALAAREDARTRMLREAQALAKVNHSNVVQVYEAGVHEGQLFIAMEFVVGRTLREWASDGEAPRPWREVLTTYLGAGRGLAAVHAAGLVHRDFKPDNAMIGDDGVVRVMDFGLARAGAAWPGQESRDEALPTVESARASLDTPLTRTGAIVGTPAYMSPEQLGGKPADAASDQFALCVALWEALYGVRPFAGETITELTVAVLEGRVEPPPSGRGVPSRIHQAVARGLRTEPDERWPSIDALLGALTDDVALRRKWALGIGAAGLVAAAGLLGRAPATEERCTGASKQLEGAWDEARRSEAGEAMLAIEARYAEEVWERTERALDTYAKEWTDAHTDSCEATAVRSEQSTAVMDLRMACLHDAKVKLRAAVDVFVTADAKVVRDAHKVVGTLRPLARCADIAALQADVAPPLPQEAVAVDAVRGLLAASGAERVAGRYDAAQARVDAAKARAEADAIEYGPVRAQLVYEEANVLTKRGKYDRAEALYTDAVRLGARWKKWGIVRSATQQKMYVVGVWQQRPAEALAHQALLEGLTAGKPLREASVLGTIGGIHDRQGNVVLAKTLLERRLEILERELLPDDTDIAWALVSLADAHYKERAFTRALGMQERALKILETALGPNHPKLASVLVGMTNVHNDLGAYDEAAPHSRRAVAILEGALGRDHPHVAIALHGLGNIHLHRNQLEEARECYERSLAIDEAALGPEHPQLAYAINGLGNVHHQADEFAEAGEYYRRALAIEEKAYGPENPKLIFTLDALGDVYLALERGAESEAVYQRAVDIASKEYGVDGSPLARPLDGLARAVLEEGRPAEAAEFAERSLKIRLATDTAPIEVAISRYMVARTLAASGGERTRAVALARLALDHFRTLDPGDPMAREVPKVEAWLATHADAP